MTDTHPPQTPPHEPPVYRPRRTLRPGHVVLLLGGAAMVGTAIWITTRATSPEPVLAPTAAPDPRAALIGEVPDLFKAPVDAVTGGVRLASDALPKTPAEASAALAAARDLLPPRPIPADHPGIPRQAGELADAFVQKKTAQVTSFELATMLGAILRARNTEPEYGFVPKARFAATELAARRFVVRPKTSPVSPWLAPDGGTTDGALPLSDAEYLGNLLGFRTLGALARQDAAYASRTAKLAERLLPDDPAILFVLAQSEALAGASDIAQKLFDGAAALDADAMTYYRLGRLARVDEKPFKAEQLFARAAEADPTFALPHIELAELTLERLDLTPKDGHPDLIEKATASLAAADKADPGAPGLRIARAHLLSLKDPEGKNDEARALLVDETKLHPHREEGWVVLANVHAAEGNDQEAIKALEAALTNGIETADVFEGLGTLYASTGKFDEGKRMIERALELNPEDPTYRTQLAQFERHSMNFFKARDLLETQVKKFPDDATAALLLAQLELEQNQPGKARVQTDRLLARDPNNKEAIILGYLIGVVEEKPDPKARAGAIEALGGPRKLAELLLQNGLIPEAETVLKAAVAADDEDLVIPVLLVAIYTAQNRAEEANFLREQTLAKVDPADRAEIQKLFDDAVAQALQARDQKPPQ